MPNEPERHAIDPAAFLMGGSVPSASFLAVGAAVTGVICEPPTVQQQRDFTTGEPKAWDDGNPMLQLVVTLQTDEFDAKIEDDDGRRRVYLKNNMKRSVADAVRKSKGKELEVGARLTITYLGDGEATKRGMNPPKLYAADYEPKANVFLAEDRSEDAPQTWTAQQALTACESAGLTGTAVRNCLTQHGSKGWDPSRDTPLIKKLIKQNGVSIVNRAVTQEDAEEECPFS